jgi:hypothetical protein
VRSIALGCDRLCSAETELRTSAANTKTPKKRTPFFFGQIKAETKINKQNCKQKQEK